MNNVFSSYSFPLFYQASGPWACKRTDPESSRNLYTPERETTEPNEGALGIPEVYLYLVEFSMKGGEEVIPEPLRALQGAELVRCSAWSARLAGVTEHLASVLLRSSVHEVSEGEDTNHEVL